MLIFVDLHSNLRTYVCGLFRINYRQMFISQITHLNILILAPIIIFYRTHILDIKEYAFLYMWISNDNICILRFIN